MHDMAIASDHDAGRRSLHPYRPIVTGSGVPSAACQWSNLRDKLPGPPILLLSALH
jgi:hypothetical protein